MRAGFLMLSVSAAGCVFGSGGDEIADTDSSSGAATDTAAAGGEGGTNGGPGPAATTGDGGVVDTTAAAMSDSQGAPCPEGWWDDAWRTRVRVAYDGSGRVATDIPVALPLDLAAVPGVATGGQDLRLVTDDDVLLFSDVERTSDDNVVVWVRLPDISATRRPQALWMYLNNPEAPAQDDPAEVWLGYEAVWHLSREGSVYPSASSAITGVSRSAQDVDGLLAGAVGFSAGDALGFGGASSALWRGWGGMSTSMWIYFDYATAGDWPPFPGRAVIDQGGAFGNGRVWRPFTEFMDRGRFQIDILTQTGSGMLTAIVQRQQWHWIVYDYDGDTLRLYVDGALADETIAVGGSLVLNPEAPLVVAGTNGFEGRIDELRATSTSRTADWYTLQHRAMTGELFALGETQICP